MKRTLNDEEIQALAAGRPLEVYTEEDTGAQNQDGSWITEARDTGLRLTLTANKEIERLRDHFAAKAMQAMVEPCNHKSEPSALLVREASTRAYKWADAMIEARKHG